MENGKTFEILTTNLKPSFWRNLKTILRQNKKGALQEFLFGAPDSVVPTLPSKDFEATIENLQNQVNSLQDRIRDLETKRTFEETSQYALRGLQSASDTMKNSSQGIFYLEAKEGRLFAGNGFFPPWKNPGRID
jgi:hypothetical protein